MSPNVSCLLAWIMMLFFLFLAGSILGPAAATYGIEPYSDDFQDRVYFSENEFLDGDSVAVVDDENDDNVSDADNDNDDDNDYYDVDADEILEEVLSSLAFDPDDDLGKRRRRCSCQGYNCGCCLPIRIRKLRVNTTCCLNVTYLPQDFGFQLTIRVGRRIIFSKEISARNPPPICFGIPVPVLKAVAKACVELYDLGLRNKTFNCCLRMKLTLVFKTVFKVNIGCLHIPLRSQEELGKAKMLISIWSQASRMNLDTMQHL